MDTAPLPIANFLATVASVSHQLQGAIFHTLTGIPVINQAEVTDTDINREVSTADILAAPKLSFKEPFLPNYSTPSNFLLLFNFSTL